MSIKIAFIGLGIMGMPMAANVAKKYDLIGYDALPKETPFPFASSYEECGTFADVIISMVPKNEHFVSLVHSMLPYLREGTVWMDMSTVSPAVSLEMKEVLASAGVRLCDAPVVKSRPAAEKGELGIYFGGDEDLFERMRPVLACMGTNIIRMGGNGSGLTMKILHNGLVGEIQNGVNEILSLAMKCGLDLGDVTTALGYGGAQCFYLDTKAANIRNRTYPTAFSVGNMNKDVHFAKELSASAGAHTPGLDNVVRVYERAMEEGYEREDFSASFEIVNKGGQGDE